MNEMKLTISKQGNCSETSKTNFLICALGQVLVTFHGVKGCGAISIVWGGGGESHNSFEEVFRKHLMKFLFRITITMKTIAKRFRILTFARIP